MLAQFLALPGTPGGRRLRWPAPLSLDFPLHLHGRSGINLRYVAKVYNVSKDRRCPRNNGAREEGLGGCDGPALRLREEA
jgi:hypothetical protein